MLVLPQGRSTTNPEGVPRQIVLEDCTEMEPKPDHQMPASDQNHHELYPLLSIQLPTDVQRHKFHQNLLSS